MLQLVHLVLNLLETAESGERRLVDGRAWFEMNVLVQQPELNAARPDDVAAVGGFVKPDEAEDRALAGAVAADQSDLVARRNPEADVRHQQPRTGTHLEVLGGDHQAG